MDLAEFDKFAKEYSDLHQSNIEVSGESPEFFAEYKIIDMHKEWNKHTPSNAPASILDFGGGIGNSLPFLNKYFPNTQITLADVSTKSIELAKQRGAQNATFLPFDGKTLPLEDQSQDLAFAACVFHHIPHDKHISLLKEIRRTLKDKGFLYIFDT